MDQAAQVVGAVLILAAYVLAQARRLNQDSVPYLLLNAAGSAILAIVAGLGRQWGFLLLEAVWVLVSLWGLLARLRAHPQTSGR